MREPSSFARRFIAGETVDEAIAAARTIEAAGLTQTLDLLGESVATMAEADAATRAYLARHRPDRRRRHRPQHLAEADATRADDRSRHVRRQPAAHSRRAPRTHDFFVRVDMENSPFTQVTIEIFETMWQQGYRNAGIVLQSYLPRSLADAVRMNAARRPGAPGERRLQRAKRRRLPG